MSLLLAKRKDKAVQKKVQSLLRSKANKKCFDCPAKDPTFININLQTFICPRCACLVREMGFRARLASSGKFTGAEMVELQYGGNEIARKIWLSSYISSQEEPDQDEDVRHFMVEKYYEKKWLDNVLLENHQQKLKERVSKSFNEDGLPIETKHRNKIDGGFSRLRLIDEDDDFVVQNQIEEIEDLTPEASISHSSTASSTSSSKFTLNPTRFFSGFSIRRSSNKKSNKTEEEQVSEPSSPVSMTITSTEENENIDFFVSPSVSSNSVSSSVPSKEPSVMMTTEPTSIFSVEQSQQPATISTDTTIGPNLTAATPVSKENTTHSETIVIAAVSTPSPTPKEKVLNVDLLEQINKQEEKVYQQSSPRYSEERPTSKINYSNIIQPVPPAKCARFSAPPTVVRSNSSSNNNSNAFSDIMSELSGLCLEKSFGNVAYSGSVLAPTSTYNQALKPIKREEKALKEVKPSFDFSSFDQFQKQTDNNNDIYQAIRGIAQTTTQPVINQHEDDPWQEFCSSSSVDEEPWQEFCSGSSVDDNSIDENMSIETDQPQDFNNNNNKMEFAKPHPSPVVVNLFEDLDPFAVSRRF